MFTIVRTEGARGLYNGLLAGLHRQMSFASVRVGLYDAAKQFYGGGSQSPGIATRLAAGCTTGALAVAVAQPTDVVKVRFQAQARLLREGGAATRYGGTLDAYRTIAREEGFRGLWKGCLPNIARNAIVNCCETVTYDVIKERILQHQLMAGKYKLICHQKTSLDKRVCAITRWSEFGRQCGSLRVGRKRPCVAHSAPMAFLCTPLRRRQHAVPLHGRLRRRLLRRRGGVSGGRDQNALHELRPGPVRRRHPLCLHHAAQGGARRLL
ncbi:mitochondrial uncoupling protein 2-like isoform X2 [Hippocampus zosterae]|nr:mitochondrial uncoupling protein 2-like isoform X2 [Hippocampus zosterae]